MDRNKKERSEKKFACLRLIENRIEKYKCYTKNINVIRKIFFLYKN